MKKTLFTVLISTIFTLGTVSVYAEHHEGVKGESEKHEIEADTNKDGKISFDEFKAAREKHMEEHFKRRDLNNDGFIDANEKAAAREKMKKMRKKMGEHCQKHDKD